MRSHHVAVTIGLAVGWSAVRIPAATLIVPDDHPTIQAAVDAAAPFGDTVAVRPGTYSESVTTSKKSLTITGLGGRPLIAPADQSSDAFRVSGKGFPTIELRGIDIVGGRVAVRARGAMFLDVIDVTATDSQLGIVSRSTIRSWMVSR
jgi:hypothetical protein